MNKRSNTNADIGNRAVGETVVGETATLSAMASIFPALPGRPATPTNPYTLVLTGTPTATIDASQTIYGDNIDDPQNGLPIGSYFRAGWGSPLVSVRDEFIFDWTLINQGVIWSHSSVYSTVGVWVDHLNNSGTIIAQVEGTLPGSNNYGFAQAAIISGSLISEGALNPALTNTGSILADAPGNYARAVYSESVRQLFINAGTIAARASYGADPHQSGGASGIVLDNGGYIINQTTGSILAEAPRATAIFLGRGDHPAIQNGPQLINHGLIEAHSLDPANRSIGVELANPYVEHMELYNNGTIKADIAIYAPSSGTFDLTIVQPNIQTIVNDTGGVIDGDIELFRGADTLTNKGTIVGHIDLGEGADVLDSTGGSIVGTVDAGFGADTVKGSTSNDVVRGGVGNDTLTGAEGNDLLLGDFGHDVLDGGVGNDGLYGGTGNDRLVTSGADVAQGGWGDDRIETGDYAFASISGDQGFDTWALAAGSRSLDLGLVAASGRVTGIEQIALGGNKTLIVHAADVAAISGDYTLYIQGTATDSVYLDGTWTQQGSLASAGTTYLLYGSGSAQVRVQQGTAVTIGTTPPAGVGGLDAIAGGAAAPAAPADANTNEMTLSGYVASEDIVFGRDEIWESDTSSAVINLDAGYYTPNFTNFGTVMNDRENGASATVIGIPVVGGTPVFGVFDNFGTLMAKAVQAGDAVGFFAGSGQIRNYGQIQAFSEAGDALAVATYQGGYDKSPVDNRGDIRAHSDTGYATGVFVANSTRLSNWGTIRADGGDGAIAVDMFTSGGLFDNNGAVLASAPSSSTYYSIGVGFWVNATLTNSGVISADVAIETLSAYIGYTTITNTANGIINGAIAMVASSQADVAFQIMALTNAGKIDGDILIDDALNMDNTAGQSVTVDGQVLLVNDSIINTGRIEGNIWFGKGNDLFDGRGGVLVGDIHGGTGDDLFYVDGQTSLIFENPNEGADTVVSGGNYYLYANIENLTLAAGAGDIFGVGNELANVITGNGGSNLLIAGAGDDVVHGGAGVDSLFGQDGADHLFGDAGIDYLVGGNGDDVIDGGTEADALYGEDGNDTLIGGTDFQTDILVGGNGNDVLHGDSLLGDYDLMDGGAGDDAYYVDTFADLTFEAVGGGTDTVYANISGSGYYLYANVENLMLQGSTAYGVGNELDNHLTGSDTANWLLGGAGNDVLNGKAGNDVLFGESGADTFIFEHGTGGDVIGDFLAGTDKIDLSAFGFANYQTVVNSMHEVNGTTAIDLGGGDFIVINGVAEATLHAGDFILGGGASASVPAVNALVHDTSWIDTSMPALVHAGDLLI